MNADRKNRRLQILAQHLSAGVSAQGEASLQHETCAKELPHYDRPLNKRKLKAFTSVIEADSPDVGKNAVREKERLLKWNGWGYKDTEFLMRKDGMVYVSGKRYLLSGKNLPGFRYYIERHCGVNCEEQSPPQTLAQMKKKISKPRVNKDFMDALEKEGKPYKFITTDEEARLFHGRGHCLQEIFQLRWGSFRRLPDVVIYPGCHEHVEKIVALAQKHNACIIPFGGGTTVSQSLMCPENEDRMIISLDTQEMNKIKWIDFENNLACIEAGAVGIEIHEQLSKHGVCLGHEPDSFEMSTLGGWVATRASGMKKNVAGNVEDFAMKIRFVSAMGTIEYPSEYQRKSSGPDIHHIMLGSEGTMGVVTEVVCKIFKLPAIQRYGSVVFPDFQSGVKCLHEISNKKYAPASIRLLDNVQFQMGSALKLEHESYIEVIADHAKKFLLTKVKGFDLEKCCAMTLLFEGNSKDDIDTQERRVNEIAKKHGGLVAGEEGGKQGYLLTYVIAYLRDIMMAYWYVAESFETFVPWKNLVECKLRTEERIVQCCAQRGVPTKPWICARVSQLYDTGVCLYFYFGFVFKGLDDPVKVFSEIESEARDEILRNKGSISHHHGIGKLRRHWAPYVMSPVGHELLRKIKKQIDPQNIFCAGNMNLQETEAVVTFISKEN